MSANATVKTGQYNSSITRVRPFFQALLARDATGGSWLPDILQLATLNRNFAAKLAVDTGMLNAESAKTRPYPDRNLAQYGIPKIMLESCFEASQPPPEHFLRWLIENPAQMKWPVNSGKKSLYGTNTQLWRDRLVTGDQEAIIKALAELEKHGAAGSKRKWWAFEGFTEVDCCLETDRFVLFIEGKRTEKLSPATNWYPQRNQIVRNLEVAQQTAKGRDYAVLVIAEEELEPINGVVVDQSLPHLNEQERTELKGHFFGSATWKTACQALNLSPTILPNKTVDIYP